MVPDLLLDLDMVKSGMAWSMYPLSAVGVYPLPCPCYRFPFFGAKKSGRDRMWRQSEQLGNGFSFNQRICIRVSTSQPIGPSVEYQAWGTSAADVAGRSWWCGGETWADMGWCLTMFCFSVTAQAPHLVSVARLVALERPRPPSSFGLAGPVQRHRRRTRVERLAPPSRRAYV